MPDFVDTPIGEIMLSQSLSNYRQDNQVKIWNGTAVRSNTGYVWVWSTMDVA